jgi:hypothetical protein
MSFANAKQLVEQGMAPELVERYVEAVNAAWAEVAPTPGLRTRPSMFLQYLDPERDHHTVSVKVGLDARWGSAEGTTPDELRKALVQHLSERFTSDQGGSGTTGR